MNNKIYIIQRNPDEHAFKKTIMIGPPTTRQLFFAAFAFSCRVAFAFSLLSFALSAAFAFCSSAWAS